MTKASKKEPRLSLFAGAMTQGIGVARGGAPVRVPRSPRAKRVAGPAARAAQAAQDRIEHLDAPVRARLHEELDGLLRRRSPAEPRIAGVLRALAPMSHELRAELHRAATTLLERDGLERELWCCAVRVLGEHEPSVAAPVLIEALARDGGGAATLTSAALSSAPGLTAPLAKLASVGRPFVAFAAEIARVLRGESSGVHLLHLAPIIKEAHRVVLATGVVLPLVHALTARGAGGAASRGGSELAPGFEVLRSAERHLGRWLTFAEAVVRLGDTGPLRDARARAASGPESSRCAWGLLAWALADAVGTEGSEPPRPEARLTAEVAARLSDRPSAARDLTFLFRLAQRRAPGARFMLDALVRGPLADESQVRAASLLARDHGRGDLLPDLRACAAAGPEELRGLALGALWDAGEPATALALAGELVGSKHLGTMAWAARVKVAAAGALGGPVVDELSVRRLQWGSTD